MPKIIENLPQRLAEEARRQVRESGYSAMTIRSVAKGCGVGTGTVYNYYDSKDALVAAFMLADWKHCVANIEACSAGASDPAPVLRAIYDSLQQYLQLHSAVFRDAGAAAGFSGSFSRYHGVLRSQLAAPLCKFCADPFTAEFAAEAMLTWTVAGKPFDQLLPLVQSIFNKEK